jgi:hypothetical protein
MKDNSKAIAERLGALAEMPYPSLGIDVDGCVDEAPLFFRLLTNYWPGKVFVLTFRDDRAKAVEDLARYGIRYDELILVDSFEAKAEVIVDRGILVYFDDQPEMIKNVPSTVNVMLVRNEGNFSFDERLWQFSNATARFL